MKCDLERAAAKASSWNGFGCGRYVRPLQVLVRVWTTRALAWPGVRWYVKLRQEGAISVGFRRNCIQRIWGLLRFLANPQFAMKNGFFVFKAEGLETFLKYFQSFTCIYRIYGIYLHHHLNATAMTTAMKYTKLKGLTLHVNFLCMLSNRSFYYSKDFTKRPSDLERAEYLRDVLQKTNCELSLIKPLKP